MKYEEVLRYFRQQAEFTEDYIRNGIETNRKQFFRLLVIDQNGTPVPGAKIRVRQTQNEFRFGANCFMLDEFECEEKNLLYRKQFSSLFDTATLPFYWNTLEPRKGVLRFNRDSEPIYRRPPIDRCLEFCEQNRIEPKAHCLVYDPFSPDWLPTDIRGIKKAYEERFATLSERYADRIDCWEVINETLCWGRTVLVEQPDLIEWAFHLAEKYFPQNHLVINEANGLWGLFHYNRSAYYMLVERALAHGARIDGVGLQWHLMMPVEKFFDDQTPPFCDPRWIKKNMLLYASFVLPVQITEVTVPCFTDQAEDEAVQAELVEKLYRMWFASPQVEAIYYWNLYDGYAAYAKTGNFSNGENAYRGGLIRFDGSEKPAYRVIGALKKEWLTQTEITSDVDGRCSFKGFYGHYELTVTDGQGRQTRTSFLFLKNGPHSLKISI